MNALTNVDQHRLASADVHRREDTRPTETPYLSVVATARNDDHGGDLLPRMQVFLNGLAAQADRFELPVELVLVEWNPPVDRPRLADALEWPRSAWCSYRIVEVPNELHMRLEHADRLPLFQMIAKNAGIRRARGEFVLATNVDVLVPDALMSWLAERTLRPDRLYRVDRHDVDIVPDPSLSTEETLRLAEGNVIRVCGRMGTRDLATGAFYRIYDNQRLPLSARRGLHVWRALLRRFRSARDRLWELTRWGSRLAPRPASELPQSPLLRNPLLFLGALPHAVRRDWRVFRAVWVSEAARIPLHTNASGDFTLLSRQGWEAAGAYPELELFSMHLDGLFLYQAHYAGFSEEWVPYPLFHIEHGHGFKPAASEVRSLKNRLERAAIPQITNEQFLRWILAMHKSNQPLAFNDDDWGLVREPLAEVAPAQAREEVSA
jgi:hypothetical protein